MVMKRAWWHKGQRFRVPSTQVRGAGWTLFGAISPALQNNSYFEVHTTTNGANFETFMTNIKHHIRPAYRNGQKRLILVADNHKVS